MLKFLVSGNFGRFCFYEIFLNTFTEVGFYYLNNISCSGIYDPLASGIEAGQIIINERQSDKSAHDFCHIKYLPYL